MTQLGRVVKDDGCKGEYAVAEMSVNRMPSKYRFWMYQNSHFPVDGSWKERFSWSDTSFSSSANSPPHRSWHLVKYQTSQWNKKDSNQHWKVTHSLMWLFLQKSMPHSVNKGRRVVSVNHTLSSLALHTRDLWTICCFLSGAVRGPDRFLSYSFTLARSQGSVKTFSSWGWPGNVRLSASQAYCVHNQCCSAFWMLETQSTCVFLVQKRKKKSLTNWTQFGSSPSSRAAPTKPRHRGWARLQGDNRAVQPQRSSGCAPENQPSATPCLFQTERLSTVSCTTAEELEELRL